jgi:hypothetical protein
MAQRTLDNGADVTRLPRHYLQDQAQTNIGTLLQRVQQKGVVHLYEFDPGSSKAQYTLGDDCRANLLAILEGSG